MLLQAYEINRGVTFALIDAGRITSDLNSQSNATDILFRNSPCFLE